MITTLYVNRIMSEMQTTAKRIIEKDGFVSPMLIVISDSHINFSYLYSIYENIMDINYSEWLNGLKITTFFLHIRDKNDSDLNISLSKYIATNYSPLAIGSIGQAYYKVMNYDEYDKLKAGSLNVDPDSIRVLSTRFYIKDNKNNFSQVSPFFITEDSHKSEFDFGLNNEVTKTRTVIILTTPWSISSSNIIDEENKNPYFV